MAEEPLNLREENAAIVEHGREGPAKVVEMITFFSESRMPESSIKRRLDIAELFARRGDEDEGRFARRAMEPPKEG